MSESKKLSHQSPVILIAASMIAAHPDPETTSLELIHLTNPDYQIVVRKGQFVPGDYAVYVQPDSVVPQTEAFKFLWEQHVGLDGTVPEKRRRVTVRKFRKQYSEGLLLPITDFDELVDSTLTRHFVPSDFPVGMDVSDLLGITHYNPDAGTESTKADEGNAPKRKFRYPRTFRGWVNFLSRRVQQLFTGKRPDDSFDVSFNLPTYDVEALKNYKGSFVPGELVVVTEKIHGSNGRFIFLDGIMYAGSRNQWKAPASNSTWHKALQQNPAIEAWCRAHEGFALYGEVIPTQKGFTYGCKAGEVKFFQFDVRSPQSEWLAYNEANRLLLDTNIVGVPLLYYGPYDEEKILKLVDGPSFVFQAGHIREGIVIKTVEERTARGLGRVQLKVVSNAFLEKDSK